MRRMTLLAVSALALLTLPARSQTQSSKAAPSQEKQPPKVMGIHCAERQGRIVGIHLCQQIIDTVRHGTAYTVRNCPDVLDKNQESHITCLPKNDANLMLYVVRNWGLSSDDGEQPVGMSLVNAASGKAIFSVPALWPHPEDCAVLGKLDFSSPYLNTTDGTAWCAINRVISFIASGEKGADKKQK